MNQRPSHFHCDENHVGHPRGSQAPQEPDSTPLGPLRFSLRLGHPPGLTCHWHVIQYRRAAALPPGYRFAPGCGARKTVRAFAFLPVFRPLPIVALPVSAPGGGRGPVPTSSARRSITRRTIMQILPDNDKKVPIQQDGHFFMVAGEGLEPTTSGL